MMTTGEVDIVLGEVMIVSVTGAVMEGGHPVHIAEKGVALIMAVGLVHIRGKGAVLTMAEAAAVVVAIVPFEESSKLVLLMGVEALVHMEDRGMALILPVGLAEALTTKSVGELTMESLLPIVLMEGRQAPKMAVVLVEVLMILRRLAL